MQAAHRTARVIHYLVNATPWWALTLELIGLLILTYLIGRMLSRLSLTNPIRAQEPHRPDPYFSSGNPRSVSLRQTKFR